MKNLSVLVLVACTFFLYTFSQDELYWNYAPTQGIKIYQVIFINEQEGIAISKSGEILKTSDNGLNWSLEKESKTIQLPDHFLWNAEIYCSAMNTNDGGITWQPYLNNQLEHFCNVYFYDKNTGWKIAEEFLTKVVTSIDQHIKKGKIDLFVDKPHQCTEYYTDMNSGWALGWCIKNFKIR